MVEIIDVYKSLNISIEAVMKNSEMLKFAPDHLNTKNMCKHAVKKKPYLLRNVPDDIKLNKCVKKLFYKNLEHKSLFLTATTHIKSRNA